MGAVVPLFMVMNYIKASFLLCFCCYAASFSGMILGIIGTTIWTMPESKKVHPYGMIEFDEQEPVEKIVQ